MYVVYTYMYYVGTWSLGILGGVHHSQTLFASSSIVPASAAVNGWRGSMRAFSAKPSP